MIKFRIVEIISKSGHPDRKGHWVIEEKKFFGWREVFNNEGPNSKSAELYLLKKYTGYGECRVYGNVYTYQPYTFYV